MAISTKDRITALEIACRAERDARVRTKGPGNVISIASACRLLKAVSLLLWREQQPDQGKQANAIGCQTNAIDILPALKDGEDVN